MTRVQPTILIVDDSSEDRATYRRYLQQDSSYIYQIFEEEDGEHGLEVYEHIQPDVILLDFLLPDIDGLEFLNELKLQIGKSTLPVVMLTGQGNEEIAVQAIKGGAQDYLVKGRTTSESLRLAVHNVIERSHLLWKLEQSEARFRTSVENMLDAFGIYSAIRDESGQILDFQVEYVNAAACESNRMTQGEQVGKRLSDLLPTYRETGLFYEYCEVVETGQPLIRESVHCPDICGDQNLTRVFDLRVAKLEDGFVACWQDVTEKKRLEAERDQLLAREQAARAEAEAANQAKDRLLARVSHDLRNPLSAILSYSQLLRTRKLTDVKATQALKTIEDSARLQNQLIGDLLDFSRITSGQFRLNFQSVNLFAVIQTAIETLYPAAQSKGLQIETSLDRNVGHILGDATRLRQIVWNLLSNAIKFTPEGGAIRIHLERTNAIAQLTVSDTGEGIDPEFLPYIFDQFRQADHLNGLHGLGLGLSIVHHLVELHGGTVQATSEGEGKGATFTVNLPLASQDETN